MNCGCVCVCGRGLRVVIVLRYLAGVGADCNINNNSINFDRMYNAGPVANCCGAVVVQLYETSDYYLYRVCS